MPEGTVTDKARELLFLLGEVAEMDRRSSNNVIRDFEAAIEGLIEHNDKTRS